MTLPTPFVTGSFSADGSGHFIPHPSQVDVDSGLPEETLDAVSNRAPSERDDDDDDGNDSDNNEFMTTTERSWWSRPSSDRSGDGKEELYVNDESNSDISSSITRATPSLLSSDRGPATESSSAISSEDPWNNRLPEPGVRRAPTPEHHPRLDRLSLNGVRRRDIRHPQRHSPDLEVHSDDDGNSVGNPDPSLPRLWPTARPRPATSETLPSPEVDCPHNTRILYAAMRRAYYAATRDDRHQGTPPQGEKWSRRLLLTSSPNSNNPSQATAAAPVQTSSMTLLPSLPTLRLNSSRSCNETASRLRI